MPNAQSRHPRPVTSALVVAYVVLQHATLQAGFDAPLGFTQALGLLSAAIAGSIGGTLLARVASNSRTPWLAWAAVSAVGWTAAGLLADLAVAGMAERLRMPEWWVGTGTDPDHPSGIIFESSRVLVGAIAGLALALPVLLDRRVVFGRRVAWSVGLITMSGLVWAAIFHGAWIV